MSARKIMATAFVLAASATTGCSMPVGEEAGADTAQAQTTVCTSGQRCPRSLNDLKALSTKEPRAFDRAGTGDATFEGFYEGEPLCRPEGVGRWESIPKHVRDLPMFGPLHAVLTRAPRPVVNAMAGFIWHGKTFEKHNDLPGNGASLRAFGNAPGLYPIAGVLNNIGRPDRDFAAEATLYLNQARLNDRSIDLDYQHSRTGIQLPGALSIPFGLTEITNDIVRHVWDRVRLVNAQEGLYVGRAYVVPDPGTFDQATAVPLCHFALQKRPAR